MKSLSPIDAVGPAFARTRSVLLPPGPEPGRNGRFRFWFLVKMALMGILSEPGAYGAILSVFVEAFVVLLFLGGGVRMPGHATPNLSSQRILALLALLGAVGLAFWIVLGWLWCRLRFTFFEMVVERHGSVRRAWARYSVQAWRYLGLTMLVSLGFLLLLALTAGPILFRLYRVLHELTSQQISQDPTVFIATVLPLYAIFFANLLLFALVDAISQDFVIPPMALENATVEEAFRRFLTLLRTQPGYVVLYFLLRFALQMGLGMAGGLIVIVVFAILCAGGFAIVLVFHLSRAFAGASSVAVAVGLGLCGFVLYFLAITLVNGSIAVFRQGYAVQFYGSFYPQLGSQVEPESGSPLPLDPLAPPIL